MDARVEGVAVDGGGVPIHVFGPEDGRAVPGLVVVTDPFWRVSGGVVPDDDHDGSVARLAGFDRDACFSDVRAVVEWTRKGCNEKVAALGICFGGPVVLVVACNRALDGVIAWHGSRMEAFLEGAEEITCQRGPDLLDRLGWRDRIRAPEVKTQWSSHTRMPGSWCIQGSTTASATRAEATTAARPRRGSTTRQPCWQDSRWSATSRFLRLAELHEAPSG